jgi:hypothetical protein
MILVPLVVQAQEPIPYNPVNPQKYYSVVKTNPAVILWGPIFFTSEFRLLNEFSVAPQQGTQIGISYLGKSPLWNFFNQLGNQPSNNNFIVRGFRFQVTHRFYLNKIMYDHGLSPKRYAPEGFYVGPLFSYSTAKFTTKYLNQIGVYQRGIQMNLNMVAGFQTIVYNRLTFDMFAGLGYKENSWYITNRTSTTPIRMDINGAYYSNLKLILGTNIGFAF